MKHTFATFDMDAGRSKCDPFTIEFLDVEGRPLKVGNKAVMGSISGSSLEVGPLNVKMPEEIRRYKRSNGVFVYRGAFRFGAYNSANRKQHFYTFNTTDKAEGKVRCGCIYMVNP